MDINLYGVGRVLVSGLYPVVTVVKFGRPPLNWDYDTLRRVTTVTTPNKRGAKQYMILWFWINGQCLPVSGLEEASNEEVKEAFIEELRSFEGEIQSAGFSFEDEEQEDEEQE